MEKLVHKQNVDRRMVIERLQQAGITPTSQRIQIARAMFSRPQHLSADQVLELVNGEERTVSKATVYNTLNLFARSGLVREIIADPSKVFYDSTTFEHHHFFNVDTGELIDVPAHSLALQQLPPIPEGTEAAGIDVIIRLRSKSHHD